MQVPLQPGLTARAKPRLVLFDDQHPAPQLCGGSDAWCWTGDEIAAVAIHRPDSRDIAAVAEQAYREAWQQLSANGHAHWLRTWTYFDDILQGEGDAERYRQFCLGRARGLPRDAGFPAATVIGSASPGFWLWVIAARSPGQRFENPRQTPAWQYPREYGPQSPGFSRALWWAPAGCYCFPAPAASWGTPRCMPVMGRRSWMKPWPISMRWSRRWSATLAGC